MAGHSKWANIKHRKERSDKNIALIEWLEGIDDVDAVYHNMKINA